MVYEVIHVLLHHSHGRRMSHVFSHSNRKRNKCLLHLPGEARSFLWRTTQFIKSIEGATQTPSTRNPVLLKAQAFLYDPHTETAYFWNRYPEWTIWIWRVWWICVDDWNRILLKSLRHKPGSSLFKWKLSGWKWRTTMLPALIASLIACVEINFAILTTTTGHFKFIEIVESLSLTRRRVKRLRSGPGCWKAD